MIKIFIDAVSQAFTDRMAFVMVVYQEEQLYLLCLLKHAPWNDCFQVRSPARVTESYSLVSPGIQGCPILFVPDLEEMPIEDVPLRQRTSLGEGGRLLPSQQRSADVVNCL